MSACKGWYAVHGTLAAWCACVLCALRLAKATAAVRHQAISVLDDVAEAVPTAELRPETEAPDGRHEVCLSAIAKRSAALLFRKRACIRPAARTVAQLTTQQRATDAFAFHTVRNGRGCAGRLTPCGTDWSLWRCGRWAVLAGVLCCAHQRL